MEILLGFGVVSVGGVPMGLTRGGSKFVVEREIRQIEADGDMGPVEDRIVIDKEVAKLTVNALELFTNVEISRYYPAMVVAPNLGNAEVASLTITNAATTSGNLTVTLNAVAVTVAVLLTDSAVQVADKIRATTFAGWTTGGTAGTTTVKFTATTVGTKIDAIYSAGATSATGTMTTTTQGKAASTANKMTSTLKIVTGDRNDIVWTGKTLAEKEVRVTVENALNMGNLEWNFEDKNEVVPELEFTANYKKDARTTPPWNVEFAV